MVRAMSAPRQLVVYADSSFGGERTGSQSRPLPTYFGRRLASCAAQRQAVQYRALVFESTGRIVKTPL